MWLLAICKLITCRPLTQTSDLLICRLPSQMRSEAALDAPAGLKQESARDRQDWTPKGTVAAEPSRKPSQRLLVIVPEDQRSGQGWVWYKTPRQLDLLVRHLNPKGEQLVGRGHGMDWPTAVTMAGWQCCKTCSKVEQRAACRRWLCIAAGSSSRLSCLLCNLELCVSVMGWLAAAFSRCSMAWGTQLPSGTHQS